jgi:hypothetical protein
VLEPAFALLGLEVSCPLLIPTLAVPNKLSAYVPGW